MTLRIPKSWDWLLSLAAMPTPAKRAPNDVPMDSHAPFRDDDRHVFADVGAYKVGAHLHSGDMNYWLEFDVRRGDKTVYEGGGTDDTKGDCAFEVPASLSLWVEESRLEVEIERYETAKRPRRSRARRHQHVQGADHPAVEAGRARPGPAELPAQRPGLAGCGGP